MSTTRRDRDDAATALRPAFLTARWRALVMQNFAVDPRALAPLVPRGTQLDAWNGATLMSLVGFRFLDTRVLGVRVPFHSDFDELNLRFYVRREVEGRVRRGVVFVREIVPRRAIAWVANAVYGENYVALPMRHEVALPDGADRGRDGRVAYFVRVSAKEGTLAASIRGTPTAPPAGAPLEAPARCEHEFITEHYWGYARQRDGSTVEYQVDHPRWNVWDATGHELSLDVESLYGAELARFLREPPTSVLVADGSEVVVRRGVRLDG